MEDRLLGSVAAARFLGYEDPEGVGRRRLERQAKSERCSLTAEDHGTQTRAYWRFRESELARFKGELTQGSARPTSPHSRDCTY